MRNVETNTKTTIDGKDIVVETTKISRLDIGEAQKELAAMEMAITRYSDESEKISGEIENRTGLLNKLSISPAELEKWENATEAVQHSQNIKQMRTQLENMKIELERFNSAKAELKAVLEGANAEKAENSSTTD